MSNPVPDSTPPGSPKTILVIEDNQMLLDLVTAVLSDKGYVVLTAEDGLKAVQIFKQRFREISLVLSDMGLPFLGGWEVFLKMREIDPGVKTIMASGYLDPKLKAEMLSAGAADFIQKPYVIDSLLEKIQQVLDTP